MERMGVTIPHQHALKHGRRVLMVSWGKEKQINYKNKIYFYKSSVNVFLLLICILDTWRTIKIYSLKYTYNGKIYERN